jgi:uncharacterized membrane protein HdeD (DUF308 family)
MNRGEGFKMDTVKDQMTMMRWALGINGVLSVALGVVIIVWPTISLYSLVVVFGAFVLARGIVGLGAAIAAERMPRRDWLVISSLASIIVGLLVFRDTQMSALALLYVIGAYAIVFGVVAIGGAFSLPLGGGDSLLLALTGLISILFGVVMFADPGDGALVVLSLIAAYALIVGITELTVAIGSKRVVSSRARRDSVTSKSQVFH